MPAKNLVRQILEQYKTAHPNFTKQETNLLDSFTDFAENWIRKAGVVGVGYAAGGISLRTTTGEEFVLDDTSAIPPTNVPLYNAVGITGNAAAPAVTTPQRPSDVSVTGRAG